MNKSLWKHLLPLFPAVEWLKSAWTHPAREPHSKTPLGLNRNNSSWTRSQPNSLQKALFCRNVTIHQEMSARVLLCYILSTSFIICAPSKCPIWAHTMNKLWCGKTRRGPESESRSFRQVPGVSVTLSGAVGLDRSKCPIKISWFTERVSLGFMLCVAKQPERLFML